MGLDFYPLTMTVPSLYPYPCRQPNASLVLVPPETTRALHICIPCQCPFYDELIGFIQGCLFKPSWRGEVLPRRRTERQLKSAREYQARMRQQLKNTRGEPLAQNCWNCAQIRYTPGGFVCALDSAIPQTAGYMQQKAICDPHLFEWRIYLDILPLSRKAQRREPCHTNR